MAVVGYPSHRCSTTFCARCHGDHAVWAGFTGELSPIRISFVFHGHTTETFQSFAKIFDNCFAPPTKRQRSYQNTSSLGKNEPDATGVALIWMCSCAPIS